MKQRQLLLIVLFLAMAARLPAQLMVRDGIVVRHYTVQDGLANNVVYCSLKSSDGFVWLGTWYGLCRFDGQSFRTYRQTSNPASDQPPRKVETLIEDGKGHLWIKTFDWKLSVFFKREERFHDVFEEIKKVSRNIQIIKIQPSGDGGVLLLTKDKNLILATVDEKERMHLRLVASSKGHIEPVTQHLSQGYADLRAGRASWVGADYSIFSEPLAKGAPRDLAFWRQYFERKVGQSLRHVDKLGNVWTIVGDHGLEFYNPHNQQRKTFTFSFMGNVVQPLLFDAGEHGIVYLTAAGQAFFIDRNTLQAQDIGALCGLPSTLKFSSVRLENDGLLWLSTIGNGVYSLSFPSRRFRLIPLPVDKTDGVRSLYQMPDGDVLVGTRNRDLYVLDVTGKVKSVYSYATYGIGSVYHILRGRSGCYWLSTKGDGLVRATKKADGKWTFEHFRHQPGDPSSISGDKVYMSYEDRQGRLWVATLDGGLNLALPRGQGLEFFNKRHGMPHYPGYGLYLEARNITEDRQGRLWVGTMDGLMSLDTHFKHPSEIRFDTYRGTSAPQQAKSDVFALYTDREGKIWVCSFGGGLSLLTGCQQPGNMPVLRTIGTREGLNDEVVLSITADRQHRLWLVHEHGVACFDPKQELTWNYNTTDGFPEVDMEESSSLLNANGEIWLGCREGIVAFRPDQMGSQTQRIPIYLVGCTVNDRDVESYTDPPILQGSITYADKLKLKYDQNTFIFEYAALDYRQQDHINYRYRLEGYDRDWHYVGHSRTASYPNVPPGNYVFKVEASNASNPQARSICSMTVEVLPPWWATWWAYLIYAVILGLVIYFGFRYARYMIRMHNDVYVQTKLSEFKMKFYLEQQDVDFVNRVNAIVHEHLTDSTFDIDAIAQQLGMSRSAFYKKLKGLTGLSPVEFVKESKLNHAVELLKSTQLNVTDVAFQSGFNDVGYFGKCFRKKFGLSPRDYRLSKQGKNG